VSNVTDCESFSRDATAWTEPKPSFTNCDDGSDTDGDGVNDWWDNCADTPKDAVIDADGCADSQKDTDGDGVTDDLDTCKDTPEGTTVNSCGCSSDQGGCYADFSGVFNGTTYDSKTNVFNFPTSAESYAGFANANTDLYPYIFPNGGSITFQAAVQTAGEEVNVNFTFQKANYPDIEPQFSVNVLVAGTVDDEETYTVEIPAQDATNTYSSLIMYLVEREIPVEIHDVFVKVNP